MSSFASYPSLIDRSVLITGGASGIGAAFVEHFARQGARMAFLDVNDASATDLLDSLTDVPHKPIYQYCDLADLAALTAAIEATRNLTGPIRILVNNAANDVLHSLTDINASDFERNVAVNLRHQVFATQAVVPDMRQLGGGSIICLGSTGWMKKNAGYPLYAMAKSAVRGFVNGMARALGQQNIRINALVPGWVITEKQARLWLDDAGREEIARTQCMPGFLMADDLARAALFLGADDSHMCTGHDFIVDGGWV
jgi:NAD(P)-dependent dehydrogenase (short-subunit alcohol dehydrogenase family)